MATGLSLPPRVVRGRLRTDDGESQMRKLIMVAVGSSESANPWNTAGIAHPVFSLNDGRAQALLKRGIEAHFRRWERARRAKLRTVTFKQDGGTLYVEVRYRDLVYGVEESALVPLQTANTGG
jgi:hypothetical protein